MKWCAFVNRRCCGEDCAGWVGDNCFIYLLLPTGCNGKQQQTKFDWANYDPLKIAEQDLSKNCADQLSFLEELVLQIVRRNSA